MADNTVTRSYSGLLSGFDHELAWSHHELHNVAVSSVLSSWLTIRSCVEPGAADFDDPETRRFARLVIASWWFTLEKPHTRNAAHRLKQSDIGTRLEQYVGQANASWFDDASLLLGGAIRDGSVWVDRRAMWLDSQGACLATLGSEPLFRWQDALNDIFGVAKLSAGKLLKRTEPTDPNEELPVPSWERPAAKSVPSTPRDWVSKRFGGGPKTDFGAFQQRWERVREFIAPMITKPTPITGEAFGKGVFDSIGCDPKEGRKGRAAERVLGPLTNLFAKSDVSIGDLMQLDQALEREISESTGKMVSGGSRLWADWVHQELCAHTNTQTLWTTTAPMNAVVNAAQGLFASFTTLNTQHLRSLIDLSDAALAPDEEITREPFRLLNSFVQQRTLDTGALDDYRVGSRSIKGWLKLKERFSNANNVEDRIAEIGAIQSEGTDVGDRELFKWLAANQKCWEHVEAFAKKSDSRHKANQRKITTITLPQAIENPNWAQFGDNYWKVTKSSEPRSRILHLWDGSKLIKTHVMVTAGRLEQNRASGPHFSPVATRNDRLGRLAATGTESAVVSVANNDQSSSMTLCFDRTELQTKNDLKKRPKRWRTRIAFKMTPTGPLDRYLTKNDVKTNILRSPDRPAGLRVFGVDLGLRTSGAFGVWETVDANSIALLAKLHSTNTDGKSFTARNGDGSALGDGRDHYRALHRNLSTTDQETVVAPWARLVAVGSIEPNRPPENSRRRPALELQHWERKVINTSQRALGRETANPSKNRASTIRWFVLQTRRAVNNHSRLAALITQLSNSADTDATILYYEKGFDAALKTRIETIKHMQAAAIITELSAEWFKRDRTLRNAILAIKFLVFGGRPSNERAIRIGLRPRVQQPHFAGLILHLTPERLKVIDDVHSLRIGFLCRTRIDAEIIERTENQDARLLRYRTRLRDDLTKQIASGIVREALRHNAHVIVLEDLENLKTRNSQPAATNRMLRRWAKTQIIQTVEQLCELHNLGFRTVRAAYTSRLDCRTGSYGLRYRSEPLNSNKLQNRIGTLTTDAKRQATPATDWANAVDAYLTHAHKLIAEHNNNPAGLWIPVPGKIEPWFAPTNHPIIISNGPQRPEGMLDADENAGANIALKQITFYVGNREEETD